MKIYSFISSKGGVGKSTLCVNLATIAAGKSLIVDCDSQKSAGTWFSARPEEGNELSYIATEAASLHTVISQASNQGFDNIFIDSAGRDAPSNKIISELSDHVIVPVKPSAFDILAVSETITKGRSSLRLVVNQGYAQGQRNQQAFDLLKQIDGSVCPTPIINRAIFQDAGAMGKSVTELEPNGKAAAEIKQLWECINNG